MIKSVCRYSSVGLTAAGVGVLLLMQANSVGAKPVATSEAKVRPTAGIDQFVPWSLALAPSVATNGAAAVSAALDSTAEVTGALGLANQVGPAYLAWNSVKSLSGSQPPAGSHQGTVNFTDMDQWMAGVSGLASSTGALGLTENAAAYDPDLAAHAGILQTNNQLGPAIFDLNVLKAIGFTQAPTGQVLNTGSTDNFAAVDIGRWNAGIPGVIMNSGTTGFVTSDNFGNDLSDYRVGGLQDTMTIGPAAFTFNFLPYVSTSVFPTAGLSFGNAQDMTAAPTPFAPVSPPTPGVIEPNGGLPVPSVVSSAQNAVASATPQPVAAITPQPVAATTQLAAAKPTTTIPGVNGAPLAKAATGAVQNGVSAATGAVQNGVSAATGAAANGISAATGAVANGFRAISGASASKSSGGK